LWNWEESSQTVPFFQSASALIVAQPGLWRDALIATLDEVQWIEAIHLAKEPVAALRSTAANCPDLVLLDADFPGDTVACFLRDLEQACPHTRSLVLSSDPPDPSVKLSADAVLIKGCSSAVLFQVLESLLPDGGGNLQAACSSPDISRR
jgi:DNA-binding NarL/FixJ family response regulator